MSIIEKCGHGNRGNELLVKDENGNEVLDEELGKFTSIYKNNVSQVVKEYDRKGFTIFASNLKDDILIPRYYNPKIRKQIHRDRH